MEISKVAITGTEEACLKVHVLFSKAGLEVVKVDLQKRDAAEQLSNVGMAIVISGEGVEVRKQVLRRFDEVSSKNAILATTASWGITEIASATRKPERVVGLNFTFNALEEEKCLVQIVRGLETSDETIRLCWQLVKKTTAVAVLVEESVGLILDRVMASVINEAAAMCAAKIATMEDIDKVAKLCLNWPVGPFEFADAIGIDNVVATLEILSQQLGQQYLPCRLLRQMVAAGRLGKKAGRGFYTYS